MESLGDDNMKICPACETENEDKEEYCLTCGQKLIENNTKEEILTQKQQIPKDKIILLDLNYTLISNSWAIRYEKLPEKINKRQYEHQLIELIKDKETTQSPDNRPPYVYQVPLNFIPGVGGKTIDKLLDNFGTEMTILHKLSNDDIEKIFDSITRSNSERKVMFITGIYPNGKLMYYAVDLSE